ncbi:PorT family protein [Ulvibacter sp.]|nr:PorT family protein [Ulvibacter sp.]
MKKYFLIVFSILVTATSFAQGIDLGIKAGINFSNLSDVEAGPSNKSGFQAGVFAGLKFNDKLGLQADLLFSQQGAEFDGGAFDLTYVNVPIVLKYKLFKGLNIQAGPQFGFIVDDNIKELTFGQEEAETADISGVVGLGYDLLFGLRIDGRYHFGLTDVFKNSDGSDSKGGKNTVVSIAVGFSFL